MLAESLMEKFNSNKRDKRKKNPKLVIVAHLNSWKKYFRSLFVLLTFITEQLWTFYVKPPKIFPFYTMLYNHSFTICRYHQRIVAFVQLD